MLSGRMAFFISYRMGKHVGLLVLLGVLLAGCRSGSPALCSIDMGDVKEEVVLEFDNLAADCHLVKLETKPDVLLEGWFKTWVGDKYIVTWGNEEMHLFSAEGRHMRKLCVNGRGPEEFEFISCLTVNENTGKLYFSDSRKDYAIGVIDLQTGKFEDALEIPCFRPEEMLLYDDSVLVCIPGYKKAEYELYKISVSGHFLAGLPNEIKQEKLLLNGPYITMDGNTCYYMSVGKDTLYQWTGESKVPEYCFDGLKPVGGEQGKEKGTAVSVCYYNAHCMLVDLQYLKRMDQRFGNYIFTFDGEPDMCLVSLPEGKVKKIKELYVNEVQQSLPHFRLNISEKYICQIVPAMQFREWTKEVDSPWHSWYIHMTDDDNPVLIIGKKAGRKKPIA